MTLNQRKYYLIRKLVMCCLILFAAAVLLMVDNPAMGSAIEFKWDADFTCVRGDSELWFATLSSTDYFSCAAGVARQTEACEAEGCDEYDAACAELRVDKDCTYRDDGEEEPPCDEECPDEGPG